MDFDRTALPYPTQDPSLHSLLWFTNWPINIATSKGLGAFSLETWIGRHFECLEQAFRLPSVPESVSLRQAWLANLSYLILVNRAQGMSEEQLLNPGMPFAIRSALPTIKCVITLHTAAIAWAVGESGDMPHTHQAAKAIMVDAADSLSRVVGVTTTVGRGFANTLGEVDVRYTAERWQANIRHLAGIYTAPQPHSRKRRSHS